MSIKSRLTRLNLQSALRSIQEYLNGLRGFGDNGVAIYSEQYA